MRIVFVKPKTGIQVRDPITGQHLASTGEEKSLNTYWRRRLRDGDIEITKPNPKMAANPERARSKS